MSDDAPTGPGAAPEQPQTQIRILGQYVKDLSFENPGAPDSMRTDQAQPQIELNLGVGATPRQDGTYEVTLTVRAEAKRDNAVAFIAELAYSGWFQFANAPQELLDPLVRVEAPRMLFPFARRILADITRDGGFPPLFLEPIDFGALYIQQRQRAAQQQAADSAENEADANGSTQTGMA